MAESPLAGTKSGYGPAKMEIVADFELPASLHRMIQDASWGTVDQGCDERISPEVAQQWDPHASGIHLLARPTVLADDLRTVPELEELWNVTDIDPASCLIIGDFGLGSDNPIVLDFSDDPPSVRAQRWHDKEPSRVPMWITIAATFDEFVTQLGLA